MGKCGINFAVIDGLSAGVGLVGECFTKTSQLREERHMRNVIATALAALILVPASWAGGYQDSKRGNASDTMKVRGVVAGITVTGETAIDLKTDTAMIVEASFLTVVGSPVDDKDKGDSSTRTADASSGSERPRHNVYTIWMTPRTKISQRNAEAAKSDSSKSDSNTKDMSFDQLEVGEIVEIEFNPQDESAANAVSPKTQQMRRTHGRHRTFSGYATSVTILPRKDWGRDRDRDEEKSSTTKDTSSTDNSK
jgi:hypothetical protein